MKYSSRNQYVAVIIGGIIGTIFLFLAIYERSTNPFSSVCAIYLLGMVVTYGMAIVSYLRAQESEKEENGKQK